MNGLNNDPPQMRRTLVISINVDMFQNDWKDETAKVLTTFVADLRKGSITRVLWDRNGNQVGLVTELNAEKQERSDG